MELPVCETSAMFHVGDVLRKLREGAGFTLEEVARQTGMGKGTISQIERGEGNPRQSTLDELAKFYKLSGAGALYTLAARNVPLTEKHISKLEEELRETEEHFDVSGYRKNDLPVIAEGEASPVGAISWDNEGVQNEHVENRMSRRTKRGRYCALTDSSTKLR